MVHGRGFSLCLLGLIPLFFPSPSDAHGGHTRPPYVDGCQSLDGRYVVTAELADNAGAKQWRYTWKDTKTGKTLNGWLAGLPDGLGHFTVVYAHLFVAPDGETFAVWQPGSFAPGERNYSRLDPTSDAYRQHPVFNDRLVVYRKTGEILRRYHLRDLLQPQEWVYVNYVHGNLYWMVEYPDVVKGGEPPRGGMRYYRISPDYTTLEFTVGANSDARHKLKEMGPQVVDYRRVVRVDLTTANLLPADARLAGDKLPGRPFQGPLTTRGLMKGYVPSLDPVRVAGTFKEVPKE